MIYEVSLWLQGVSYAIVLFPFGKVSLNGGNIVFLNYGFMVFLVNTLVKTGVLCSKVISIWPIVFFKACSASLGKRNLWQTYWCSLYKGKMLLQLGNNEAPKTKCSVIEWGQYSVP